MVLCNFIDIDYFASDGLCMALSLNRQNCGGERVTLQ